LENPPDPIPSRIETEFDAEFAATRSGIESEFRSPIAMERGDVPTWYCVSENCGDWAADFDIKALMTQHPNMYV